MKKDIDIEQNCQAEPAEKPQFDFDLIRIEIYLKDPTAIAELEKVEKEFRQLQIRNNELKTLNSKIERLRAIVLRVDHWCRTNDVDMEQFLDESERPANDAT